MVVTHVTEKRSCGSVGGFRERLRKRKMLVEGKPKSVKQSMLRKEKEEKVS